MTAKEQKQIPEPKVMLVQNYSKTKRQRQLRRRVPQSPTKIYPKWILKL